MASINYKLDEESCRNFLEKFQPPRSRSEKPKYFELIEKVAKRESRILEIDLDDVKLLPEGDNLCYRIQKNTKRYLQIFYKVTDEILSQNFEEIYGDDVEDVINASRPSDKSEKENKSTLPEELKRKYELVIKPSSKDKILSIRQIRASDIGSLVTFKGIVTRISDVKPRVVVATYSCDQCGSEVYQEVLSRTFTPLVSCTFPKCQTNGGKLYLQTRGSKFIKFQELKIQELSDQVPVGHVPRSITVQATGERTRRANPGDVVQISGIFLPTPHTGFAAIKAGLLADTFIDAMSVEQMKKQYSNMSMNEEIQKRVEELKSDPEVYSKLAWSIAPEIYGHEDVKKALLLLLVGGVTRVMDDGMKIRGDINVCLMGDPGVAKSQLLKYIASMAPRGVYTTGKGSSGVGLTAAVMKDPVTNEMILEGGALVLADNGVCCIDEFDKMEESDRTAIHEVMEQQTVSISKAGINTTLNARTSILAAANPAYGRYNPKRSPLENINLPAALLSRFDLLFLILDKANIDEDLRLAQHVTHVHMTGSHPALQFEPVDVDTLRAYISEARKFQPYIPSADDDMSDDTEDVVSSYIVDMYLKLRSSGNTQKEEVGYVSPRSLLAILRISQSLARLRMSEVVQKEDVDEAIRLMESSKASLDTSSNSRSDSTDPSSMIYSLIRDMAGEMDDPEVDYDKVLSRVLAKGLRKNQLDYCLKEYEDLNIWILNSNKTKIRFVESRS